MLTRHAAMVCCKSFMCCRCRFVMRSVVGCYNVLLMRDAAIGCCRSSMLCGCRYVLRSVAGCFSGLLMRHAARVCGKSSIRCGGRYLALCVPGYFDVLQRGEVCCRDSQEVSMMQRPARQSAKAESTAAFCVAGCCRVLQCVAGCFSAWMQRPAAIVCCRSFMRCGSTYVLQYVVRGCSML